MTQLLEIGAEQTTLLTVNNRLAAELRRRFDQGRHAAGADVWASADIVPWDAWLGRCYEQLIDAGVVDLDLLNPTQERLLWQSVIERDPRGTGLLRPAAAAQSAQASARLYAEWRLDRHPLGSLGGDETAYFLAWRRTFERTLEQRGQLTRAHLLPILADALAARAIPLPQRLLHAGFDTLSPAQQAVFAALVDGGCNVDRLDETGVQGQVMRVVANDSEHEIRMAAAWADAQTLNAPNRRVAIVVPQIGALRATIERIFTATLAAAAYRLQARTQTRFDISLGTPLADRPLVDAALLLLDLLRGEHPLAQFGQLLRSPFVGGHGAEWAARALLDAALRDDGLPLIGLRRLRWRAGQYDVGDARHCPALIARIDDALTMLAQLPERDTPNAWVGHLQQLLAAFGWPGDAGLDSHEYQQHERLLRAFSELATLGKVHARIRLGDAVQWLRAIAQESLFQAQSPPVPIQVLGPLEAAGMRYDAIWLLGMHDQAWPAAPNPDPLLPSGLQRELGMPHASAERELTFARDLTDRLLCAAPELIASHARLDGERELRPSPLTAGWPLRADPAPGGDDDADSAVILEPMRHVDAAPARADQAGGAGLLGAQAACPFRAVATFRLRAGPLAEPAFSADGAMLGTLVHELLQRVWHALSDSHRLAAHDDAQLGELIAPLAHATLADVGRRRPDVFTPRFCAIEAQRLTSLVIDWLAIERQRRDAFEVAALEQQHSVEIGGLTLRTRADRVDRLADGSLAVIDYKTGRRVSSDGWLDERVSEPQLPLYSLVTDAPVSATVLARVRNDQSGCRLVGLSRDDGFAPGVAAAGDDADLDWSQTQAHWRRALTALAQEVAAGRADPTPSIAACQYCPLPALCRVAEFDDGADND